MKQLFLFLSGMIIVSSLTAQKYPDPEFGNEVYCLKKDSAYALVRLEKNSSKMETKTKAAGFGGSETSYSIDGDKSPVRFAGGKNLTFVFSTGQSSSSTAVNTAKRDSMLRANGMDPSMMGMMSKDPSSSITLYKVDVGKSDRKIILQKAGGVFSSHKVQSSDKYTFSVKKVREGYWELMIDKTLPKGEYAFAMMDMTGMSGMAVMLIFSFGVD